MREAKHSLEQVLAAIKGTSGIKRIVAQRLDVHRNTVDNYLKRWMAARLAYDEEVDNLGDLAESVIIRSIQGENVETAKWFARMKLQHRGYVERQEITGKEGGPLRVKVTADDLTDDELAVIAANGRGGVAAAPASAPTAD